MVITAHVVVDADKGRQNISGVIDKKVGRVLQDGRDDAREKTIVQIDSAFPEWPAI